MAVDLKKLKKLHKEYQKVLYAEGGKVKPSSPPPPKEDDEEDKDKEKAPFLPSEDARKKTQEAMRKSFGFYADGGEVDPEHIDVGELDPSLITPDLPKPLEGMEVPEDTDAKAMEQMVLNEDFDANEKSAPKEESKEEKPAEEVPKSDEPDDEEKETAVASEEKPEVDKTSFQRLLAAVKPQFTQEDLAKAQRERDLNNSMDQFQRGAAIAGGGMAKADPSLVLKSIDENAKLSGMPVQKYGEQAANQKNDPNSPMSQAYREAFSKFTGKEAPPNWAAADLEKVSPLFEKFVVSQQSNQLKKENKLMDLNMKLQIEQSRHEDRLLGMKSREQRAAENERHNQVMEGLRAQLVGLSEKRLGSGIVSKIENDPTVKKANDRINSTESAIDQLQDLKQPLTYNRLNAVQIDLANTLNYMAAQGGSDYKAKSDKLENAQTQIAGVLQKYGTNLVDLRKQAPEVYHEVLSYAKSVHKFAKEVADKQRKALSGKQRQVLGEDSDLSKKLGGIYDAPSEEKKSANEVERLDPKSGKVAIFDSETKKFIRWK